MVIIDNHEIITREEQRLRENRERKHFWKRWGPYVAERQWATVREDYSENGDAWSSFTHDDARSRVFRWGEDGIAGVSDSRGLLNITFSFWNEQDDFLKERLFGLSNPQGNHGESVKEAHFHLDNTPTHSYMKYLYKYPQKKFPYEKLVEENGRRSRLEREYNILDTGIFSDDRYWDIFIETAKEDENPEELMFRLVAYNRGPEPAPLHIIPQVCFRNTWKWGHMNPSVKQKPSIRKTGPLTAEVDHWKFGKRFVELSPSPPMTDDGENLYPRMLFTENEANGELLWGQKNAQPYVKDAFHRYVVDEEEGAVNPREHGTKFAAWYAFDEGEGVPPGECAVIRFRFSMLHEIPVNEEVLDNVIDERAAEADEFYDHLSFLPMSDDLRNIQRQAFAGMLWNKKFYHFIWDQWREGDPNEPPPPVNRRYVRNQHWKHMYLDSILSMPDAWEYPFFAAWDTAFHCIPLAMIDPDFAKNQLDLLTREWYLHPNGQMPAYEWNFSDVNPPVHAWATFRIFKVERRMYGREDFDFLERVFQKLLLNFTWWVNRKDSDGNGLFEGGFLGLDNIGLFNRSEPLPTGGVLEQADSTGWMAFYCLCMLQISLELAKHRRTYEDIACKFFEHFILISDAMAWKSGEDLKTLWNDDDGFYYDAIAWDGGHSQQLPVRSLVGLIPLYAVLTLEPELISRFPSFKRHVDWFIENKNDIAERNIASMRHLGKDNRLLLTLVSKNRLERMLRRMLDETEFLSEHGIRSMSKYHRDHPYTWNVDGQEFRVAYVPGESDSPLFGGNSNWRGPIWLCVNFLLIESLQRFFTFYGAEFQIECPTGSGEYMHLGGVAQELQRRLQHLMARDETGRRAIYAGNDTLDFDPHWKDYLWFYEYFDADTGRGMGASHQCGWTGLIAKIIHDTSMTCRLPNTPQTPTTAASHYFDEVLSPRSKPTKSRSRRSSHAMPIRRSSLGGRSIGNPDEPETWLESNSSRPQSRRSADFEHYNNNHNHNHSNSRSRSSISEYDEEEYKARVTRYVAERFDGQRQSQGHSRGRSATGAREDGSQL